jgi:hypothetical protein
MSSFHEEVFEPTLIILGIFGYRNDLTKEECDHIFCLILQEVGRLPDKVLLPLDGKVVHPTTIYIQEWTEMFRIQTQCFQSDWARNGKIAQVIRDDRIQKECTHSFLFLSKDKNQTKWKKLSEKMAKNKTVFTYDDSFHVLTASSKPKTASKPAHKSDIEKGQTLLKFQKKGGC